MVGKEVKETNQRWQEVCCTSYTRAKWMKTNNKRRNDERLETSDHVTPMTKLGHSGPDAWKTEKNNFGKCLIQLAFLKVKYISDFSEQKVALYLSYASNCSVLKLKENTNFVVLILCAVFRYTFFNTILKGVFRYPINIFNQITLVIFLK